MSVDTLEGLVLAHLGQGIAVEHNGDIILCQPLRKLDTVTVGDRVLWSLVAPEQGRIEAILPRRSVLTRPSRNEKIRPVAANIDTVYVVFAVEPYCDFLLLDQYLAICENRNFNAALILNKTDLPIAPDIEAELATYVNCGYALYRVSANSPDTLGAVKSIFLPVNQAWGNRHSPTPLFPTNNSKPIPFPLPPSTVATQQRRQRFTICPKAVI
jgi:ribosome biogenesis GTPase